MARAGGGDVCRPQGRGGAGRRAVSRARCTPTRTACSARCRSSAPRSTGARQARRDPRPGAQPASSDRRLRLRRPLPARHRSLPAGGAGARAQSARSPRGLPLRRRPIRWRHDARCSKSTISRSIFRCGGGLWGAGNAVRSTRSTACRSTSTGARRCRWSANPAAASPPSAAPILRLFELDRRRQVLLDGERIDNISRPASCGRCAGACRWCSRTRSAASIRA